MKRRPGILRPTAFVALLSIGLVACLDDVGGPKSERVGYFSVAPRFATSASTIVSLGAARLTIERKADGSVVTDTVISISTSDSTVDLSVEIVLLSSTEEFLVTIDLYDPANTLVWSAPPVAVTATTDQQAAPAVSVEFSYVGPGSDAASVVILNSDTGGFAGDTVALRAEARDSTGQPIDGAPIAWYSLDAAVAKAVDDTSGRVVGLDRGDARIVAELLTGQRDTLVWHLRLPPTTMAVLAGDSQTGAVTTTLSDSIVVEARGSDAAGVAGVPVRFTTTDGGTLIPDSTDTDAFGRASFHWTLGSIVGTQTVTVDAIGFDGVQTTVTATAIASEPAALLFAVQPSDAAAGATIAPAVEVAVLDVLGDTVTSATENITLSIANNPGGGTLSGTLVAAPVNGVATFNDLSIDAAGAGYTLQAASTGLPSVTSDSFDIVVGQTVVGNAVEFPDNSSHAQDFLLGSPLTVTTTTTLTHLAVIGKAGGPQYQLALYTDTGGDPDSLVAYTDPLTLQVGVQEIAITPTALPAGTYWIMGIYETVASIGISFDDANAAVKYTSLAFGSPLPLRFPVPTFYTGQEFNYYIRVSDPQVVSMPTVTAPQPRDFVIEAQSTPPSTSGSGNR